jgi:hypothetical protein
VRNRTVRGDFALHALLGADYVIDPGWLVGADPRGYWIVTHAASPLDAFICMVAVRLCLP